MQEIITQAMARAGQLAESPATLADAQLLTALVTLAENAAREEPWRLILRAELAETAYAAAVAAEDAEAVYELLTTTSATYPDPIPIAAVRADLARALFAAQTQSQPVWVEILRDMRETVASAVVVPRAEVAPILSAATSGVPDGLPAILPGNYQVGRVDRSRLETLGIAGVVTHPAIVAGVMGW